MSENETILQYAKTLAKPWAIVCYILAGLLTVSLIGNVYQGSQKVDFVLEQENQYSDYNLNGTIRQ